MIRYLIALACCLLAIPAFGYDEEAKEEFFLSTPEQISSLSSEPSYLIGGLISPLSGQPVLRETDLVAKGAQNIVLSRVYIPPYMPCSFDKHEHNQEEWDKDALYHHLTRHYKGWQFYPHLKLTLNPFTMGVLVTEPSGMSIDFRLSGPNYSVATVSSAVALSNIAGDTPSGKHDFRNTKISYADNGNRITVYSIDGGTRFYYRKRWAETELLYLLEKEILPNGRVLKYHYSNTEQPDYIESLDPKERFVYASIRIQGSPWEDNCHFTSSSGLTASYGYHKRSLHVKIKEKEKHWYGDTEYELKHRYRCPPILTSVNSPFYRHEFLDYSGKFLLTSYSGKDDSFTTFHTGFGEESQHYRVHKLQLPIGQNDSFQTVYELSYRPPIAGHREGTSTVKNSDGTSLIYHFSKNLLTTLIQYFGQDGGLKKEKVFSWDDKNWLKVMEMRDGQKNILYRKAFEYDRFGNPILEVFTGDLTGNGNRDTFTTKRTFSEEGKNLLLREETDDGKVICFSYLPNTDLVTSRLTKDRDRIILREFSLYDDCNNLVQTISDDGASEDRDDLSHITERLVTTYTLRQSAPFLHMPEWIEETYWESGIKKPLKKSHLIYDPHGNVAQEEVYDAEGNHAYTICKTYNERGDVLTETNRLGQQTTYTYDSRGRLETSLNFSHRLLTTLHHDTKGRLKAQTEEGDDGVVHEASAEYDFHDRKIQKRDSFQNATHYTYDPLVSGIIKTDFPSIASIDGRGNSVSTHSSYDPFGRQITKTDANGSTTTYRYNTYGSPVEIHYPDGSKEHFRYTKKGLLESHTNPDGVTIHFAYDVLGRVLSKTYLSSEGKSIAEEIFTYSGFNLLTETDKEGNLKRHSYDGAGRKIREEFCGHVTDFSYDALGWLCTICKHNDHNPLLIHYKRDLEGRVTEERKTDSSGHLLYQIGYSYDKDGNQETITRYINGKEAVDTFVYDSFHRQIEYRDAKGFITKKEYNEGYTNSLGQKVLQTIATDPHQIARVEIHDAFARTVRKEVLSPQKSVISGQELTYDPQGNLVYQKDHVYENSQFKGIQTIKYTHTSDNRVASITRAFGTKEARTTSYTYCPSGKIATKTLPDGVTLTYSYHPLGFMSRLDSSDGQIHHSFAYDKLGFLKYALDENYNIAIKREVDPFGNVVEELFPNGLEVKKDYDAFNRLIGLRMNQEGEVLYAYDPLFLRQVTRTSNRGDILYSHTYEEYDLDGNLITESLIGNLGQITHATDIRGQKTFISSPYFSEECAYDEVGNLVSNIIDKAESRYSYDGLFQLSSEKNRNNTLTYVHDSLYNRTQKNGVAHEVNELNELLSLENGHYGYDLNGNQILRQTTSETFRLTYDPLHRLVEATSETQKIGFVYDPLGRRLSKAVFNRVANNWKGMIHEYYLYHGQNEIGAFTSPNEPINLRVLGLAKYKDCHATVGVEIAGQIAAPIIDGQGNIRRLIDLDSKAVVNQYDFTAFGEERQVSSDPILLNPWRFASKRLDPELGLIYFGKRYYDPLLGRWLTTDPAGFTDSSNLYQYVFNNPFRYRDPDGKFLIALSLLGLTWKVVAIAAVTAYVTYELEQQHHLSTSSFARSFNSAVHQVVQNIGGVSQYAVNQLAMGKKQIDARLPDNPDELLDDPNWEETSHPDAKEHGHRTFENTKTGEKIRYDEGKQGATGHKAQDHWHRHNPDSTGDIDKYLDANGNPVPDGHPDSHLYPG